MAMHRWQGYDHPTLHTMINNGPGAAASTPQTTYWEALTTELAEIDADLNRKLGELGAAWEGAAGESATAGLTPLQAWATDAQSGTNMMKSSTEYQADMISRARAEMPEPVEVTTPAPSGWAKVAAGAALLTGNAGPAAAVAGQSMDHEAQEAKQDQASQKAVDTMDSYQNSSEFNRNTLGTFVPPPDVVVSTPEPASTSGSAVGNYNTNYSGTNGSGNYTSPSGYSGPPTTGGGGYVPPSGPGGGYQPPSGTPTTPNGYVPPVGTTPSGYVPPTVGPTGPTPGNPLVPGTTGPNNPNFSGQLPLSPNQSSPNSTSAGKPTGGPGGKGGGGLGQGGLGQGGDASRQASQLGKGGAGGFGQGGPGGPAGGRGGAASGGKGMGGGMGGGRGAQGEEDEEYELANYLVETEDVFGDDRMVAPTVIGETSEQ